MKEDKAGAAAPMTMRQNVLQMLKFALFSVSAGLVQAASFTLMLEAARLPYWPSYLIALTLSVLYNFTINRRFTFKSAANIPAAMLKVAGFYAVFTPLSTWLGSKAATSGVNEYIVLGGAMVCNLLLEYLFCRFVVYRNSMNTNALARKPGGETETGT